MFFTGCVGAALMGPAATESAMAAAAVMPSSVVVLIVCSFGVVEKSGNKWAQGRRQFTLVSDHRHDHEQIAYTGGVLQSCLGFLLHLQSLFRALPAPKSQ